MFTITKYSKCTVTDTSVNNSADLLGPTTQTANRQGVRITNCAAAGSGVNIYIGQISESTGTPTLSTSAFDDVLVPGAAITYMASGNVRFYAINNSSPEAASTVRFVEYI